MMVHGSKTNLPETEYYTTKTPIHSTNPSITKISTMLKNFGPSTKDSFLKIAKMEKEPSTYQMESIFKAISKTILLTDREFIQL